MRRDGTAAGRIAALLGGAALLAGATAWLAFGVWLATPLEPCPYEGSGPCDRPSARSLALAGVALPGALAGLALALGALRFAVTGRRRTEAWPYLMLAAAFSFAGGMLAVAGMLR